METAHPFALETRRSDRLRFAFVHEKAGNAGVLRTRPENTGTPGLAGWET